MPATNSATPIARPADGIDPGAVDNRLSLDPNNPEWKRAISGWEDGGEYELKLTVTQISPGEFEVLSATSESESESEGEDEDEMEDEAEPAPTGKVNRSVKRMMSEGM